MARKKVPGEQDALAIVIEDMHSQFRALGEALEAVETRLTHETRRSREELGAHQAVLELAIRENTAVTRLLVEKVDVLASHGPRVAALERRVG